MDELSTIQTTGRELLGPAVENYVKAIFKLSQAEGRVTPTALADHLRVTPAAIAKMVRRLAALGLVSYARGRQIGLTTAGEKVALEIVRHHRLLETYLMEALGYTWDQVDAEAERLEHAISEEFEDRIAEILGHPDHDPHGDPIPTKDGRVERVQHPQLSDLEPGQTAVVRRVTDGDPGMLRYLGDLGLYPHTPVEMLGCDPYGGPLRVRIDGAERAIGRELAQNVFVAINEGVE